jgi:DnaJ-class molecular chaperone
MRDTCGTCNGTGVTYNPYFPQQVSNCADCGGSGED